MSAGRSRFVTTVDTLRAIMREIAAAGGIPGIERVAPNPVEEDMEKGCDRIHAILSGNGLSEVAVVAEPGKVTVEMLKGTVTFASYDIPLAAATFIGEVRKELAGPTAEAAIAVPQARTSVVSASKLAQRIELAKAAKLPEPRKEGPKARFRETTVAVGLVRTAAGEIEGVKGFVVNPEQLTVEDGEDRLHALLDDGTVSSACLFCGPGYYAHFDGNGTDELSLAEAAKAFIASVRAEALATSPSVVRH